MKVALVNTNRFIEPPVIPVGIEYLHVPLEEAGHEVTALDLAFRENPLEKLISFLEAEKPEVIGFSVRNVDTTIMAGNIFFLEDVSRFVSLAKECTDAITVAGGSSTLCSGHALAEKLGVDYLIQGPGEIAFPALLEAINSKASIPRVLDGWSFGAPPDITHKRGDLFSYRKYIDRKAPAGIEFKKGCSRSCSFCLEREKPIFIRSIENVIKEARELASLGIEMFFFCDSEVNLDFDNTIKTLRALAEEDLGVPWTGYFIPKPFDPLMAHLTSRTGCRLATVSVTSWELSEGSPYTKEDLSSFCELCSSEGIKVAVDLLVGAPAEPLDSIEQAFEACASAKPDTIGVNSSIRLYEGLPITEEALKPSAKGFISGKLDDNPGLLEPVWFSKVDHEWLIEKIGSDPLFVIEGESAKRTVNYERI